MKMSLGLQKARGVIEDKRRWCKEAYENPIGQVCALGALWKVYPFGADDRDGLEARWFLEDIAEGVFGEGKCVAEINDGRDGHRKALRLYDVAISAAMSNEAAA